MMAKLLIVATFLLMGRVEAFVSHRASAVQASRLRTSAPLPVALTMTATHGSSRCAPRPRRDGGARRGFASSSPVTSLTRQLRQTAERSLQLFATVEQHGSRLGVAEVAAVLTGLSKLAREMPAGKSLVGNDARFGALLERAGDVLANHTEPVQAKHVVQIALALAHTDARARCVWVGVAARGARLVDDFGPKQISQMAWACSKAPISMASTMARLAPRAVHCVPDLDGKELAMLVYAFAKVGVSAPRLYAAIAQRAEECVETFNAQNLANTAWAFATADASTPRLFAAIAQQVEERAGTAFNAQNLANIAWAFATAGVPAPRLYATIAQQAEERIGIFTAQNLANIAWAFAKADVSAPRLYAAIAQEAEARVSEFKAQELANIVWAFATAGVSAPRLFATIAQQAEARAGAFNAQSLANTAWAFATAGVRAPRLYAAIARQVEEHADTFTAQGLANTVWAFAKAGVNAPRLYAAIAQQAEKRAGTFNVQNLANTAWAFATAGVSAPRLYAAIAQQVEACVHTCRAQELANIAWAFATAGVSAPRLYAAISQQAEERVETFNAQDLANTASALSTSAVLQEPWPSAPPCTRISPLSPERHRVVLSLVEQWLTCGSLSAERTSSEMSAIERALLACDVCMRAERSPADAADRMRVAELRRQARELSSCFDIEPLVTESAMQRELSTRLAAAGWAHADEVPLADGLLIVDMACEKTRVVVEIDGPTHYLRDVSSGEETYNGSTRVKTRLLRLLGWRVIRVGWREWARGPDARELLVQRLLARCRIRTDV